MENAEVDGVRLAYEVAGHGDETIALLNGIAMSIGHWKPIVTALSEDRRCLMHDFRGQLLSDKPEAPYSLEQHADDTVKLFDAVGVDSAHLLGTSYGGEIALVMAYRHPDRVRSLVIIDSVSETAPVLCSAVNAWKAAALADPVIFYRTLIPWNYSDAYINRNASELRDRESKIAELPAEYFRAFADLCDAFLRIDATSHLGGITCPTLVIVADQDILKPRRYSEIINERIRDSELAVIHGSGHAVVIEKPEEIVKRARAFYERLSNTSRS